MKKGKHDRYRLPFVALGKGLWLRSAEWRGLSPGTRDIYSVLKAKFNGANNGDISLHYSELRGIRGLACNRSISRAFKELESKGWISKTRRGGLYRYENKYRLTGLHDDHL